MIKKQVADLSLLVRLALACSPRHTSDAQCPQTCRTTCQCQIDTWVAFDRNLTNYNGDFASALDPAAEAAAAAARTAAVNCPVLVCKVTGCPSKCAVHALPRVKSVTASQVSNIR